MELLCGGKNNITSYNDHTHTHCIGLKIWHNIRLLLKYATQNNIDVSFQLHVCFYRLILKESKVPDF